MTAVHDAVEGGARRRRGRVPPLPLLVPALVGLAFLVVPLIALLVRAPWAQLPEQLTSPEVWQALQLSLVCATLATLVSLVLGVPLAWLLARTEFPGRGLVRALVTLPLVLPPVVGGVALLTALGRNGVVGQYLDSWFGITLPFTTTGVVIAEAFVAMPFLVISVEGTLRAADPRYEEAATTLGASRFTAFRRVTLPLIAPGIASKRGARVGAGARRVRRDDHLRRATFPAAPRPCRSPCTSPCRATRPRRSPSAWCCSPCPSRCSRACVTVG